MLLVSAVVHHMVAPTDVVIADDLPSIEHAVVRPVHPDFPPNRGLPARRRSACAQGLKLLKREQRRQVMFVTSKQLLA